MLELFIESDRPNGDLKDIIKPLPLFITHTARNKFQHFCRVQSLMVSLCFATVLQSFSLKCKCHCSFFYCLFHKLLILSIRELLWHDVNDSLKILSAHTQYCGPAQTKAATHQHFHTAALKDESCPAFLSFFFCLIVYKPTPIDNKIFKTNKLL